MSDDKLHIDDGELRQLLHLMSHDVRNPLAAIVTNLEFARRLVSRMSLDPDLVDSIEDSVTACDVLRRLVSNFDLLVRGRSVAITLTDVNVKDLVQDLVRRCEGRASQASLSIEVVADESVLAQVDKAMLALATENLISNAIQHAPRHSKISVVLKRDGEGATITVRDQGTMISDDKRERALGAEGHTPTGRQEGTRYGRGLGLLSARAAAQANGLQLTAGGRDGYSELTLRLPQVTSA